MLPRKLVQMQLLMDAHRERQWSSNSTVSLNVNMWDLVMLPFFCRFALSLHFMLWILNLKWWHLGGSGISQDVKMLLNMQRNIMCQFQFQRNQYTAEIETCGTLVMRYILLFIASSFLQFFFLWFLFFYMYICTPQFYTMVTFQTSNLICLLSY